ncbi:MAG: hypothetical protein L3J59_16450, partial [Methylococcaceae bacterium]|nr:hypothetical protein [Methylococcaceae bacterium]
SDIETAVSLDPENAIMRSYLGKAYYELRNDGYAETELTIAKEMDPNDPTPWFYDAIRKQTTNRPVEALHDMQKAIELNDNRGVYRSKLLLDEDAAARSANMARIYQDLGFSRVALKEAWNALGSDSTNPSAHRFLSDAYIGQPRFRIARASELLQAQLLQSINVTPVQPQLTAENIGILNSTGPSRLSAGEYDPMFTSNGAHILLNGAYGSNNTITDNAIISGVYDQLSLSFGQFHFQTDGFRENDDYQQDVYNAFFQYAVTPDFNIQFEFKTDDVRSGDVPFRLNGIHRKNLRQTIEHDTARVGTHFRIDAKQDLILSAFYTTRKDTFHDTVFFPAPSPFLFFGQKGGNDLTSGYQTEIQYLFHPTSFDITMGLGYLELEKETLREQIDTITPPIPGFTLPQIDPTTDKNKTQYFNTYLYFKHSLLSSLTSTLGISYDSYQDELTNKKQLNPKFGLVWNPFANFTLRGASFRSLKRPLASNQTIEPTQIAGFNQFFDGLKGTTAWQYSLGADYQPLQTLFMGGELNWRYTNEPVVSLRANNRDRNEVSHIAYLYWTPANWLSLRAEYQFEKFYRDFVLGNGNDTDPQRVSTQQIPLTVNFFHGSGVFAKFNATYVKQKVGIVTDLDTSPLIYDREQFWTFDTALGYRLPKKLGLISVEVRNLFDNRYAFQSAFDASGPQLSPFVPEREIFIKLSLFY